MPLPHRLPKGLPCPCWTPNSGWVPLGLGTPPLPQPPLRGAGPGRPAFTFASPSLPPTHSGTMRLEGAQVGRDQAQDLSRFLGGQVSRGNLPMLPFDPLPSQWFPNFPLPGWDPFPSPRCPSGAPVPSHLHFSFPFTRPPSYPVAKGSSRPLRCPWSPTGAW